MLDLAFPTDEQDRYVRQYGSRTPPWRDAGFFETIPDLFTLDLDETVEVLDECQCSDCQFWFPEMRQRYQHTFFLARHAHHNDDLLFHRSLGLVWPVMDQFVRSSASSSVQNGQNDLPEVPTLDCAYDPGILICLGRDEPLGVPTTHNRVHIRSSASREETTFTIRSFTAGEFDFQNVQSFVLASSTPS